MQFSRIHFFVSQSHHTGIEILSIVDAFMLLNTPNRTILELKLKCTFCSLIKKLSQSHHTGIEISQVKYIEKLISTPNRTILELKYV